jgi:hypothetical protein
MRGTLATAMIPHGTRKEMAELTVYSMTANLNYWVSDKDGTV